MKKENLLFGVLSVAVVASTAFSFLSIKKLENSNNNESLRYQKIAGKEEYRVIGVGTVLSLDIKIPSKYKGLPVTEIAPYAFENERYLESIEIPDNVTSIGKNAFFNCISLTSVEIPDGVTSIGGSAFYYCNSLTSVVIPDSVTSIGEYAFLNCGKLTSVTFENTEGWFVSRASTATSGTNISSMDLSDTATAATYLKSTYDDYYWKRSE